MEDKSRQIGQKDSQVSLEIELFAAEKHAVLVLRGDWLSGRRAENIQAIFDQINTGQIRSLAFSCDSLGKWDSSLLVFLRRLDKLSSTAHIEVDLSALPDGARQLLHMASGGSFAPPAQKPQEGFYDHIGSATINFFTQTRDYISFTGEVAAAFGRMLIGKSRMRRVDFTDSLNLCGPDSLGIVTLISVLVGLVVSFIGAMQLEMFGAEIFVADMVVIAMLREMGPIMTGIIIAGRVGASFAATLSAMKVNEEADALETLGISPVDFLALPRVLAMTLMLPLLVLYSDFAGIIGGALAGGLLLDVSFGEYYTRTVNAMSHTNNLLVGLVKAALFGVAISMCGCRRGLNCSGSSTEVGRATTKAVVDSIVWIVIIDSVAAVTCQFMGF